FTCKNRKNRTISLLEDLCTTCETPGVRKNNLSLPPTKPICNVQGKPEYGQNINLTCVSEEASPSPTYKWESYDVQNNLRPLDPKSTVSNLFNVTKETSGYYICTSTNKVGSALSNFTLSIVSPSMNMNSIAGIIGGVAAALILLVIIICCCYWRKKKQQEEAYVFYRKPCESKREFKKAITQKVIKLC
uniref:Ig-like domain-containing protein n=1 Tax=Oryzias latipes TaxID=8090 RepID=A0A3P9JMK1_ORYLA